jgi:hypothetical protein
MRACGRVALVLMVLSASFGLTGCAAIDELREAFLRWVESEKLPTGAGDLPDAAPTIPPETAAREIKPSAEKTKKAARKPPQPQIITLPREKPPIPDSSEATEGTEGQSAPSPLTPPQLPSRWPPAPPPGRFSR